MPSIIATLRVQEGKAETARELLREIAEQVRKDEPGTLAYIIHQRADDAQVFMVYEKYENEAALKAHSANLAKHGPRFASVLAGRPEIAILQEI
jgi:quinol monooxygenase YgiN